MTEAVSTGENNCLAVRVLCPTHEAIEGISMKTVPLGRRNYPLEAVVDCTFHTGGIIDAVELLLTPAVRIENMHVMPDWQNGEITIRANVRNAGSTVVSGAVCWLAAPASGGVTLARHDAAEDFPPGDTLLETVLALPAHRLWSVDDPFLYRVTVQVQATDAQAGDAQSVRCGFRDFRFARGFFRLNGKRIRLHGSLYTVLQYPGVSSVPRDRQWVRQDVLALKAVGFNAVRIHCGAALPAWQLDILDELGVLVMEEHLGATAFDDSPQFAARWDQSIAAVMRRDRNHPCIVMWSLLNEVFEGFFFRHAAKALPSMRQYDTQRMILLNSGRFDRDETVGSFSNPLGLTWEHGLQDLHTYPSFPHTWGTALWMWGDNLHLTDCPDEERPSATGALPALLSEYGVCGAEDYPRYAARYRHYGLQDTADAIIHQRKLDRFLEVWRELRLQECWTRPEEYFADSQRMQAQLALDDYNIWMSNPSIIGSFTSTQNIDAWQHGCGIYNYFREAKPALVQAFLEMAAPLRLALFVEKNNIYRGTATRLLAVLINQDAMLPGAYPVSIQVVNSHMECIFERTLTVDIPEMNAESEPPFARVLFAEMLTVDGPSGVYRFQATFAHGVAAGGGSKDFYVTDPADLPPVTAEVAVWGDDDELCAWLTQVDIQWRKFNEGNLSGKEVILVAGKPAGDEAVAFASLTRHIASGGRAVFLTPATLLAADDPQLCRWFPRIAGSSTPLPSVLVPPNWTWYFHADHWAKEHPIFAGLPAGGLMDYQFYRDLFNGLSFVGFPQPPEEAVCGSLQTSGGLALQETMSAVSISVHHLQAGRFILNSLRIRENLLGKIPAAEHLLRNMLNYAAKK